jgi:hypothetical protein
MSEVVPYSSPNTPPPVESYTDVPVGEILARTREFYNLSIWDVEMALRIRGSQLMALEKGEYDKLPGRVYAIGFVRAYAQYLGLDGGKMVHLYKVQAGGGGKRPTLHKPAPASASKLPNWLVLIFSFIALSGIALTAFLLGHAGSGGNVERDIPLPPVPKDGYVMQHAIEQTPLEKTMYGAMEMAAADRGMVNLLKPEGRIAIRVLDTAWVEIRNSKGKPLVSRILKPGDTYLLPDEKDMKLDTGNIGALEFTVDGELLPPLGPPSEIRRGMDLDPDELKAGSSGAVVSDEDESEPEDE